MMNNLRKMKTFNPCKQLSSVFLLLMLSFVVNATPKIQTWQTENGVRVFFVPATEIPMLDVRITFDAGSARDDGKSGLALWTKIGRAHV